MLLERSSQPQRTSLQCLLATSSLQKTDSSCNQNSCTVESQILNINCNDHHINKDSNSDVYFPHSPILFNTTLSKDINTWHCKLGHPAASTLSILLKHLPHTGSLSSLKFCSSCQLGKSHSQPFSRSVKRATQPLELIHTDL